MKNKRWKHRKTGNIYISLTVATDATNATIGTQFVVYYPEGTDMIATMYVREREEFLLKFEAIKE